MQTAFQPRLWAGTKPGSSDLALGFTSTKAGQEPPAPLIVGPACRPWPSTLLACSSKSWSCLQVPGSQEGSGGGPAQVAMGSWCRRAACQSLQLEALLAQVLLKSAVIPDNRYGCWGPQGGLQQQHKTAPYRLPWVQGRIAVTFGIMMQPQQASAQQTHHALVQEEMDVSPPRSTRLHTAPRQGCFCLQPGQVSAFPPQSHKAAGCQHSKPRHQNRPLVTGPGGRLPNKRPRPLLPRRWEGPGRQGDRPALSPSEQTEQNKNRCRHLRRDPGT